MCRVVPWVERGPGVAVTVWDVVCISGHEMYSLKSIPHTRRPVNPSYVSEGTGEREEWVRSAGFYSLHVLWVSFGGAWWCWFAVGEGARAESGTVPCVWAWR